MFKKPVEPMTQAEVPSTWNYLVKWDRGLRRNVTVCRIIQPLGAVIFSLNLLLATMNLLLAQWGEKLQPYFDTLPLLPSMLKHLPHGSLSSAIVFFVLFGFLLPLAICGCVAGAFYLRNCLKFRNVEEPLVGSTAQCAEALTHKAETVYELRRKLPRWSIYLETGILTGITALLVVLMFIDYAASGASTLQLVLVLFILLVSLFAMFWFYAAMMYLFTLVNSLFYFSPGQWKLYALYHRIDAYWETNDPKEFARRNPQKKKEDS